MKTLVVGANGQIGSHIIHQLSNNDNHEVIAMVRTQEQAKHLTEKGIDSVIGDLEGSVDALVAVMKKVDAIIFTAGSGGKTGFDKTLLIDLDGAVKTVEAAVISGVDRFIIVSALQAHNRENWNDKIRPYYAAKHYADKILISSNLNYTIIRPGGLVNEKGTGKISIAENLLSGSIPREDVASTVIAALDNKHTFRKSFDLISGELEISKALDALS
ncbi:SDR family oxidoreductase [Aquibacillus rhizosphaerae]|uniref:SDR family oxidoreductase n=1 Tax=Aquibacillus rhizosphaerae TaxID=3051431 RepID=A0ABT7L1C4_9BACI|nr:SDR family oxidoreductase [Aquibacillus sp. LR5S19]MDL4839609.1 SDR family oxidoreductase [Aquibacillus sp. LR5S19]